VTASSAPATSANRTAGGSTACPPRPPNDPNARSSPSCSPPPRASSESRPKRSARISKGNRTVASRRTVASSGCGSLPTRAPPGARAWSSRASVASPPTDTRKLPSPAGAPSGVTDSERTDGISGRAGQGRGAVGPRDLPVLGAEGGLLDAAVRGERGQLVDAELGTVPWRCEVGQRGSEQPEQHEQEHQEASGHATNALAGRAGMGGPQERDGRAAETERGRPVGRGAPRSNARAKLPAATIPSRPAMAGEGLERLATARDRRCRKSRPFRERALSSVP
jgi:hypothetical protein